MDVHLSVSLTSIRCTLLVIDKNGFVVPLYTIEEADCTAAQSASRVLVCRQRLVIGILALIRTDIPFILALFTKVYGTSLLLLINLSLLLTPLTFV